MLREQLSPLVNIKQFDLGEMRLTEAIFDGFSFYINIIKAENLLVERENIKPVFCNTNYDQCDGITIEPSDALGPGRHLKAVNRALIHLANLISQAVNAKAIIWKPAWHMIGADYFNSTVQDFINDGPLPILALVRIDEDEHNIFQTTGMAYFADQEIRLHAPDNLTRQGALKRLVRVCHDISVNGKISETIKTPGLEDGENIIFEPSKDAKLLSMTILSPK